MDRPSLTVLPFLYNMYQSINNNGRTRDTDRWTGEEIRRTSCQSRGIKMKYLCGNERKKKKERKRKKK